MAFRLLAFNTSLRQYATKANPINPIKPFDFKQAMPYQKAEAWWLDSMHKAVSETEERKDFIKNYMTSRENTYSYFNHPTGQEIMKHPLVNKCGHTGMTFAYTVHMISSIYNNGWDNWMKIRKPEE